MKFQDLRLSEPLLRAIGEKGYTDPTPIQQQAIPPVLEGRDLQGCAQTGTGKTAAFTLPMLQLLAAEPAPKGRRPIRALVLTPTRELAIQIDECCRDYARYTPIRHCVIFGGVNQRPQVDALQKGVDLLVATPGRLLDLIGQGYVTLDTIRFFVLDEADRMLDMGFIHDIRRILPLLGSLPLDTRLLTDGGRILGFTVMERIGDTLMIHIEKGLPAVRGIYPMLVTLEANAYPDVRFVNREEDDGNAGLRQSKLSYHPVRLLQKYYAEIV